MFYGSRVVDINDGKPKWSGLNDSSDLLADSEPDLKKRKRAEAETEADKEMEGQDHNKE